MMRFSMAALAGLVLAAGCSPAGSTAAVAGGDIPAVGELPTVSVRLSVAEAYAAIPHRQVSFRFDDTTIGTNEARYLEAMFFLIDQGTRVRVTAYADLYHDGTTAVRPVEQLQTLIDAASAVPPPPGLEEYHQAVVEALALQQAVFREWGESGTGFAHRDRIGGHPAVRNASALLQRAYGVLMRRYGAAESQHNKDAMFDYHCALDFL